MGSRDHLIPSLTVDKNGHTKTVYVSPGSGNQSSMLSFAAPSISSGYSDDYDEDEEEYGPEWRNVDNPEDWAKAGFDADDAEQWSKAGFDPETSSRWSENNFDPREAEDWHSNRFHDPDIAFEWRGAISRIKNPDMDDVLTLCEEKTDSYDAQGWIELLRIVRSEGRPNETMSDLIQTMNGLSPEAGDAYHSCGFPYSQWGALASAGVKVAGASVAKYLQQAVDEYYQESEGDEYVEESDTFLDEALMWMDEAKALTKGKYRAMAALINDGTNPKKVANFRRNSSEIDYQCDEKAVENILKADKWAEELSSKGAGYTEKAEAFKKFHTALSTIPEIDEFVRKHGADKVEAAMQQGMLTEPQLRNYLELIPVAAISEGAL